MKVDLTSEIMWLNSIGLEMQKNYQIWHHRRCIFEMWVRNKSSTSSEETKTDINPSVSEIKANNIDSFKAEFWFLDQVFDSDSKNYHAWSHKIWLIERYELWNEPDHMTFAEEMLNRDVRNNSVWSFRYFLVMRGTPYSQQLVERECRYVLERRLADDWTNEAAWAYLRGFLAATKQEAEQSLTSNARRLFCGDLPWMRDQL